MKIFRNKKDQKLYILSKLVLDIWHTNNNGFAGIYANPYKWQGKRIVFHSRDAKEQETFIDDNFEVVAESNSIP